MNIPLPGEATRGGVVDTKDMNTEPTNKFQVEIDTQLADLYAQDAKACHYLDQARKSREYAMGKGLQYEIESAETRIAKYKAEIASIREQREPLEAIYNAKPWSRFFLCNAHSGHIHSTLNCSTTFMTTAFSWLPELSGLTEVEAVEAYGEILCSVCYPSAPVAWTTGVNKKVAAERGARDAARAAKAAEKATKAITAPDGSPLVVDNYRIGTLVTAQRELVSALTEVIVWDTKYADHANYTSVRGKYHNNSQALAEAIAAKTGTPVEQVIAEANVKATKKYKKDWS